MRRYSFAKPALLLLFVFMCVLAGRVHYPISVISAVMIHEIGHLAAAKLCGVRLQSVEHSVLGIRMRYDLAGVSVWREIIVCLGGSAAGIASSVIAVTLGFTAGEAGMSFTLTSLTLSALNLLPIRGFDGGEIAESLLSLALMPGSAYTVAGYISKAAVLLFWIVTLRVEMRVGINLSMLALSVYLIYSAL